MKTTISIILLLLFSSSNSERKILGNYYNYFGCDLKILEDHTFIFNWRFDMASSWSKGKWNLNNDTIYFQVIPVHDTLRLPNKKGSLFLSLNQIPELQKDQNAVIATVLISGGQNKYKMPSKLFFKEGKLIEITKSGKLDLKQKKLFWSSEKKESWYLKE